MMENGKPEQYIENGKRIDNRKFYDTSGGWVAGGATYVQPKRHYINADGTEDDVLLPQRTDYSLDFR